MARLLTGLTPAQEQATQERLFVVASLRIEAGIRREVQRAMLDIARNSDSAGKQSAAVDEHRRRVERILMSAWRSTADSFAQRILRAAQKRDTRIDHKSIFGGYESFINGWIARYGSQKITQIVGTTRDQVIAIVNPIIADGIAQGLGQEAVGADIERAVRDSGGVLARARARVIARTETHQASQAGNMAAAMATDIPIKKEWISANQPGRTRDDHLDASGQMVPINAPFVVGGESLMYPGDPSGSAGNVINCRCTVGYVVD